MTKSNIYPVILVNKNARVVRFPVLGGVLVAGLLAQLATRGGVGVLHVVGGVGAELN